MDQDTEGLRPEEGKRTTPGLAAGGDGGDQAGGRGVGEEAGTNGHPPGERAPLKVAIVGTAPGWEKAPFDDPTWQVWGISRSYMYLPRWTWWFELHRLEELCKTWEPGDAAAEAAARETYMNWLREAGDKVWIQGQRPELPEAREFPINALLEAFPQRYWTNSIAYLIGFAIVSDAEEIGVWGVDMALDSEYRTQRPSCEYVIGVAEGHGIKVTIPPESDLLKCRSLYAFEDTSSLSFKLQYKRADMLTRRQEAMREMEQARLKMAAMEGALEMVDYVEKF